jgi:hypothetical protein
MLKIPVQLLRNSFCMNFIQPGIPLLLRDLPALRPHFFFYHRKCLAAIVTEGTKVGIE